MRVKKVPMRTCVSCGRNKPKKDLARFARTSDKEIIFDISGKVNGRGAYICRDVNCFMKMKIGGLLARALDIKIEPDKMEQLEEVFKKTLEDK